MKASPEFSARPSLSCRIARLRAALTGNRPGHADSCPDCQARFAAEAAFDQQLTRESRILTQQPAPDGLEQLIMSGVHARKASARASRRRSSPGLWSLAGIGSAVAAAALVVVVFLARMPSESPSPDSGYEVAASEELKPEEVAAMMASVEALPRRLRSTVLPTATRVAQSNPLLDEVDFVYADARSALDFLAMNFLPTNTAARPNDTLGNHQG